VYKFLSAVYHTVIQSLDNFMDSFSIVGLHLGQLGQNLDYTYKYGLVMGEVSKTSK
jgi:hypothetical protein